MSRLFITAREQQLIADLTKEFYKDVVGQTIYYYPVSTLKTRVDPIYDEAIEKIFETPITMDVLAGQPEWETRYNAFGNEQTNKIEVYVHARDLIDKGYALNEGDFFVYGDNVFEIESAVRINQIFGQAEYNLGYKIDGKLSRKGQIDIEYFKKLLIDNNVNYIDSKVQKVWQQQRGISEDLDGQQTGDVRQLRDRLGEDMAPVALGDGARVVNIDASTEKASSFDNEGITYPGVPDIYNED